MMRDTIVVFLQNKIEEIKNIQTTLSEEEKLEKELKVVSTVKKLLHLLSEWKDGKNEKCDGNRMEEVVLTPCFVRGMKDYDGLCFVLSLYFVTAIKEKENSRIIKAKLLAMLPKQIKELYLKEDESEYISGDYVKRAEKLKCEFDANDEKYAIFKIVDDMILRMEKRTLMYFLRESSNESLFMLLRVVSGKSADRIFSNLSRRLGEMFLEEMEQQGDISAELVAELLPDMIGTFFRKMMADSE